MTQSNKDRLKELEEDFYSGATKWGLSEYQIKRLWDWIFRNFKPKSGGNDK